MNPSQADELIRDYLRKVDAELGDVPVEQRSEIVDDLRAHIDEAIGDLDQASEADVRNVLERLGDPAVLAAEARERTNAGAVTTSASATKRSKRPGTLEIAAIVLTAVFWPVGVVLAWVSDRWLTRDKVVATIIPAVSTFLLAAIVVGGMFVFTVAESVDSSGTQVVQTESVQEQSGDTAPIEESTVPEESVRSETNVGELIRSVIVFGLLGVIVAGPFIAALYLAIRLQPIEVPTVPNDSRGLNGVPAGGSA